MLRISFDKWVDPDRVTMFTVLKGAVILETDFMDERRFTLMANDPYLADVCSTLNIPYNVVQGLLAHGNTNT